MPGKSQVRVAQKDCASCKARFAGQTMEHYHEAAFLSGVSAEVGVVVDLGGHAFQMLLNSIVATLDLPIFR